MVKYKFIFKRQRSHLVVWLEKNPKEVFNGKDNGDEDFD